ncbi:MAG: UDP-2,3-diacylglucosamine diphosphatase [Saprospiraceae bacterium]|nr:UDP-2,3-diacylglucosamine diphosphatase [Saprospiraceae bacterium]
MSKNKIYLASDFHLGLDLPSSSREREKRIVAWLHQIENDCEALYLVGDVFDYWFEYNETIPKGCTRLLGKLANMADNGAEIHLFTGNHDMWMFSYFQEEFGIRLHKEPMVTHFFGEKYFIAHGDGLGPGDHSYKIIKMIFSNSTCQFLFHWLHPNFGLRLMKWISRKGRLGSYQLSAIDEPEKEWLVQFARSYLKDHEDCRYFVFGHRHFPMVYTLSPHLADLFYLGDWLHFNSYLRIDENGPKLQYFEDDLSQSTGK